MKIIIQISIVSVFILTSFVVKAQQLVSTTGGLYSDDQVSVSWTIGEPVIETFAGDNYVLTQGFQQPGLVVVGVEDFDEKYANIKIYPNPTSDYVRLDLNVDYENLSYRVLDASGKVIENNKIQDPSTQISFNEVESGLYLIQLMDGKETKKIFRIVKN